MTPSPTDILSKEGPLAAKIAGFTPRRQQQEMAECVSNAIRIRGTLVCEAGTGTGKTFAYLVPALLSGKKVIISTGTKALQEQLYYRDLPMVRSALKIPVTIALLKGRANYLCLHRLSQALTEQGHASFMIRSQLNKIQAWRAKTVHGDIAEIGDIPENAPVWPLITSTNDNCLGQECPRFDDCHMVRARREALKAEVLVVNHHLFFADMALKVEGFGEILPGVDAVIFDEAHKLYDTATMFFGQAISSRQLYDLARDSVAAALEEAADMPEIIEQADCLETATRDLRLAFGLENRREAWEHAKGARSVQTRLSGLLQQMKALKEILVVAAERGKSLESCLQRTESHLAVLSLFVSSKDQPDLAAAKSVLWYETRSKAFMLRSTPIEITGLFAQGRAEHACAWIFTSATLAVGQDFSHFQRRLGLTDGETRQWDSPFDFYNQALLHLPEGLPDPRSANFTHQVVELALPVLAITRGRAFLLFTSHRALEIAAKLLAARCSLPLFKQGEQPKTELLEAFRRSGNGVLLGTASFWEGVDVRGEALSCVIIDKLPFAAPDDPVLQARLAVLREQGGNPFIEYQLPEAVIVLKQGVGRLIRDEKDRGIMMLCDPRVKSRSYGKLFLDALPSMRRCSDLETLKQFFS